MTDSVRILAYYLPQFHPIPENDKWWGKGFTEWTNVRKAKPMFRGHIQPRQPVGLGYYDLRNPSVRVAQAELAKKYGIEGFCYWHYWLGNGKRLLERPFDEVLSSGEPDFPFCLGWANHSWAGVWFGAPKKILMAQTYPGKNDYKKHFQYLLKAFNDPRYITVEGKPLFLVLRSREVPNVKKVMTYWRQLAVSAGLKGIHIVAHDLLPDQTEQFGFDASTYACHRIVEHKIPGFLLLRAMKKAYSRIRVLPLVYEYEQAMRYFIRYDKNGSIPINDYPCIVSNWDSTPRLGKQGLVLQNSTPDLFRKHIMKCFRDIAHKSFDNRIVFLKSWNEWAEGNYVEPDNLHGYGYLNAIKKSLSILNSS